MYNIIEQTLKINSFLSKSLYDKIIPLEEELVESVKIYKENVETIIKRRIISGTTRGKSLFKILSKENVEIDVVEVIYGNACHSFLPIAKNFLLYITENVETNKIFKRGIVEENIIEFVYDYLHNFINS